MEPARAGGKTAFSEQDWAELLTGELGRSVRVRFGRARSSVLRAERSRGGGLVLHMSSFFARAPEDVRTEVAGWLRRGARARRAQPGLTRWIDGELARVHRESPAPRSLRPRGEHHDLAQLAARLVRGELAPEFAAAQPPAITWGRPSARGPRRTLRLGSYDAHQDLVRIHPVLDQPAVPDWFVGYVLFHELLHAVLPEQRSPAGRRVLHGAEFRARETAYSGTARALEWERAHIASLLRSARSGRPMAPQAARPRGAGLLARVQGILFPD